MPRAADLFAAEILRQITDGAFERGFRHAHDVIVRDNFFSSVVSHGDDAATVFHERGRSSAHGDQGVDADVVRNAKALAGGVHEVTLQFLGGGEGHAVH
jgi:hypothetical protein